MPLLQDCGHAWYVENYRAFFDAIRQAYPHMQLIANCDLRGDNAPTQEFDWHIYTSQWDLINRQHEFDNMVPGADPLVFASEYAVTQDGGWGNLKVRNGFEGLFWSQALKREKLCDVESLVAMACASC